MNCWQLLICCMILLLSQITVLRTGCWSTERTWADTCGRLQNCEICWRKRCRGAWHCRTESQLLLILHVPRWAGKSSYPPPPRAHATYCVLECYWLKLSETYMQVVLTSTDPSELCINGMSFSRRASKWANSDLVVTVSSHDFKPFQSHGPLAGVEFQVLVAGILCDKNRTTQIINLRNV